MTAAFTIILPHRKQDRNTDALNVAIDCLMRNTANDFILSIDAAADQPLAPRVNRMVIHAPTEICVYWASDIFAGPEWDVPMLEEYTSKTLVTGVLVEPGVMAMHGQNYHRDFGRRPETYERELFEAWVLSQDIPMLEGEGFYCPYLFNRDEWLAMGGYTVPLTGAPVFDGADVTLFNRWKESGRRIVRARSYAYHLQRWSDESEQEHAKRL